MKIPKDESGIEAFAMIVDINGFTLLVNRHKGASIAQFTRDVLVGGIELVQQHGGNVVGLMGDAFYALLPDARSVIECSIGLAVDINKQCEFLDHVHSDLKFTENPRGVGVKIGIEYGLLDIADIQTNDMGPQHLFVGDAVIYASRITSAGKGNRCLLGPVAAEMVQAEYNLNGPYKIKGKTGERHYTYYRMDLSDIWLEGPVVSGEKWYLD